jgi:hypothetical protein
MHTTHSTETLLVNRPRALELLGISRETLNRLIARGVIEEVRFDPKSHPRFRLEDILRLAGAERDRGSP